MNTNETATEVNMKSPDMEEPTVLKCTPDEILLAALIAEVGTHKFGIIRDSLSDCLLQEQFREINEAAETPLLALMEHFGSSYIDEQVQGGLSARFVADLGQYDLRKLESGPYADDLSTTELTLMGFLSTVKVGELQEMQDFVETQVSMNAGQAVRDTVECYLAELRSAKPEEVILSRLPERLKGAKRAVKGGGGLADLLTALLSRSGVSIEDVLGLPPGLSAGLFSPPSYEPTVGDFWRSRNVPFGLPDSVETLLRCNPEAAAGINMDGVRSTPLNMLGVPEFKAELFRNADGTIGKLMNDIFVAMIQDVLSFSGSFKEAEVHTYMWLVEKGEVESLGAAGVSDAEGKFVVPTTGCDCVSCMVIKRLALKGTRFVAGTGQAVKDSPASL